MTRLALLVLLAASGTATGAQLTNLGIATPTHPPGAVSGDLVAWVGDEFEHGADLDGDGSRLDLVLFVRRASVGTTRNTMLSVTSGALGLSDRLCLALVRESQLGSAPGQDLNGDGDRLDSVFAVYDSHLDLVRNLGLAGGMDSSSAVAVVAAHGPRVLLGVSEGGQGLDLNADGDIGDLVLHQWHADTLHVVNLGLAVQGLITEKLVVGPRHAVFLVSESGQGVDLNGDGDLVDAVAHHLESSSGSLTNLALAGRVVRGDGDLFAIVVQEETQGWADLDGDGDSNDDVLHAYLAPTATLRRLSPSVRVMAAGPQFDVRGYVIAWAAPEQSAGQGTDWNGNGYTNNVVLCTHQARSGITRNSGLAIPAVGTAEAYRFAISDGLVMASVDEGAQSLTDWNGDGLANDDVAILFDATTGALTNLGIAAYFSSPGYGQWSTAWVASRGFLAFGVDELGESQDLNGDGRIAPALGVYDLASGNTTILPVSPTMPLQATCIGERVFYLADESVPLPAADRNGDGDTLDDVLTSWSATSGMVTNHALALKPFGVFSSHDRPSAVLVRVDEIQQGNQDLNGDGNAQDEVAHLCVP